MKTIKLFLALCTIFVFSSFQKTENTSFEPSLGCLHAEILIVSDWSGSIRGHEHLTKSALTSFIGGFDLSEEGVRIGLITFDDEAVLNVPLTSNENKLYQSLNELVRRIPDGGTNMSDALLMMIGEFGRHGREDVIRIGIIISDGEPQYKQEAKGLAHAARSDYGINIFTIYTGDSHDCDPKFLEEIASEGCYVDTNYEGLKQALQKLDFCM